MNAVEAKYYEKKEHRRVRCLLCPQFCVIRPSAWGTCNIRHNIDGVLYASEYGRTVAMNFDPIEKKPLYHFKPGSVILSIGPNGCNFTCEFCQNWSISQDRSFTRFIPPEQLVQMAGSNDSVGVAFTYTEPLVWFEYILDCAKLLKEAGLASVIVSNGFINEDPARELFPFIDAANFDLKSMNDKFYRKICGGRLKEVLATIKLAHEMEMHVELTNLLIPGENDSDEELNKLIDWVYELSPKTVLHISRYFPGYNFEKPPTPPKLLARAWEKAKEKLDYVYTGNISGIGDPDTRCLECNEVLIERRGYSVAPIGLNGDLCARCGRKTDIVV